MPNIATINGIAEDNIATHNGITAANVTSRNGDTWVHYQAMVATGGNTHVQDGSTDYKVATFTSGGDFEVTTLGDDAVVEYLVIAGGGGGGASRAGGGGAGGYRTATGFSVSATTYTITIGGGGAGGTTTVGINGSNSVFSSITSTGGGWREPTLPAGSLLFAFPFMRSFDGLYPHLPRPE